MPKEIVGIGAANVDIMGESAARLVMEDSNPGTLSVSVGGVTRNVCENTARLGLPTRLITTVGEDMYGEKIRSWCRECGIATDSFITLPGKNSSSYVSIHRSDGEMAVALSDMRILQELTPARLEPMRDKLSAAAAIVVDACRRKRCAILSAPSGAVSPSSPIPFLPPTPAGCVRCCGASIP